MTEIVIRKEGRAGRITLNRPQALNALTHRMALAIDAALAEWRDDPDVDVVVVDAAGDRAFCAGGDLAEVYDAGKRGDFGFPRRFWAEEYRMNAHVARYPKPYVALMRGHVLGGGVGVGMHGSHRIVGDTSKVAMPECAIGLIPDVGGSLLLAEAPGRLGEYLGLTGHRMGPGEAIHTGFADVYIPETHWTDLIGDLVRTGDPGVIAGYDFRDPGSLLRSIADMIDDAFSAPDLGTLVARLAATDWGAGVLATLRRQSPLSMACTLDLVRAARAEPGLEKALSREFRFTARSLADGDLLEGIRAQIIDKDRNPQWRDGIDDVRPAQVAAMLATLGPDELTWD